MIRCLIAICAFVSLASMAESQSASDRLQLVCQSQESVVLLEQLDLTQYKNGFEGDEIAFGGSEFLAQDRLNQQNRQITVKLVNYSVVVPPIASREDIIDGMQTSKKAPESFESNVRWVEDGILFELLLPANDVVQFVVRDDGSATLTEKYRKKEYTTEYNCDPQRTIEDNSIKIAPGTYGLSCGYYPGFGVRTNYSIGGFLKTRFRENWSVYEHLSVFSDIEGFLAGGCKDDQFFTALLDGYAATISEFGFTDEDLIGSGNPMDPIGPFFEAAIDMLLLSHPEVLQRAIDRLTALRDSGDPKAAFALAYLGGVEGSNHDAPLPMTISPLVFLIPELFPNMAIYPLFEFESTFTEFGSTNGKYNGQFLKDL